MPFIPEKLPDSSKEISALIVVGLGAALAALLRILYGKDEIEWRMMMGSMGVACLTGCMTYGFLIAQFGPRGGYFTVAMGIACGMFTDDVLKRARNYFLKKAYELNPPHRREEDKEKEEDSQ